MNFLDTCNIVLNVPVKDSANYTIHSGKLIHNPSFHNEVVVSTLKHSKTLGTGGYFFAEKPKTSDIISALQWRIY